MEVEKEVAICNSGLKWKLRLLMLLQQTNLLKTKKKTEIEGITNQYSEQKFFKIYILPDFPAQVGWLKEGRQQYPVNIKQYR